MSSQISMLVNIKLDTLLSILLLLLLLGLADFSLIWFVLKQNVSSSLVYEVLPWGLITVHYEQTYNHETQYEQPEQYPGVKFAQPAAQLFPIGDP